MFKNKRFILLLVFLAILCFLLPKALYLHRNWQYVVKVPVEDYEYKKEIVRLSHNPLYRVENIRNLVGKEELSEFIKSNNNNPDIYTPSRQNISNKTFQANLHMHTINSDGSLTVEELLNSAQAYAETMPKNKYMYVAITDHNTVLGAMDIIKVLQKNPNRYNKVRVIAGMEIFSEYQNSKISDWPVEIHILLWGINPYEKYLNTRFYKANLKDKYNRENPNPNSIDIFRLVKDYGIVGVAHPARYTFHLKDKKYDYIETMLSEYIKAIDNQQIMFVEGYYQSYNKEEPIEEYENYLNFINKEADAKGIMKTGSMDTHGRSIFSK